MDELPAELISESTMQKLERAKKVTASGTEYWHAREIMPILGYSQWDKFTLLLERAEDACKGMHITPQQHFRQTAVMLKLGNNAQRTGVDFQLTRAACYLVAMNGDPSKPEIATAQGYFAVQARRMEIEDQQSADAKRLELREKVSQSHKRVSSIAQKAGVRNQMQGVFHDSRFRGMYRLSSAEVKRLKGLAEKDNFFDFAGPLELSAHDFQMNLAADVIDREEITGEQRVIDKNRAIGQEVRAAIEKSGGTLPENLPLAAEPIGTVRKRLSAVKTKKLPSPSSSGP